MTTASMMAKFTLMSIFFLAAVAAASSAGKTELTTSGQAAAGVAFFGIVIAVMAYFWR